MQHWEDCDWCQQMHSAQINRRWFASDWLELWSRKPGSFVDSYDPACETLDLLCCERFSRSAPDTSDRKSVFDNYKNWSPTHALHIPFCLESFCMTKRSNISLLIHCGSYCSAHYCERKASNLLPSADNVLISTMLAIDFWLLPENRTCDIWIHMLCTCKEWLFLA